MNNGPGEWAVSYHGTKFKYLLYILQEGLKPGQNDAFRFGQEYSIYSSSDINVAADPAYATPINTNTGVVQHVFQNRLDTRTRKAFGNIFGSNVLGIRPYGILVRKVNK